jgi:hypothetical protein
LSGKRVLLITLTGNQKGPDATLPFPLSGDAGRGHNHGRHFFMQWAVRSAQEKEPPHLRFSMRTNPPRD